jgi:hypothetical protein
MSTNSSTPPPASRAESASGPLEPAVKIRDDTASEDVGTDEHEHDEELLEDLRERFLRTNAELAPVILSMLLESSWDSEPFGESSDGWEALGFDLQRWLIVHAWQQKMFLVAAVLLDELEEEEGEEGEEEEEEEEEEEVSGRRVR